MLVKNGKGRSRIVKEVKGLVKGDVTGGIQVPQVGTNCTMWNQVGEMYQMGLNGNQAASSGVMYLSMFQANFKPASNNLQVCFKHSSDSFKIASVFHSYRFLTKALYLILLLLFFSFPTITKLKQINIIIVDFLHKQ